MKLTTIILDMYGVIMEHPDGGFYDYINKFHPNLTHDEMFPPVARASVGETSSITVFKTLGFTQNASIHEQNFLDSIKINKDFLPFIKKIEKNYRLAILSNDPSEWSAFVRNKYDLNRYFDVVVISGDVKTHKPLPEIYTLTLNKLYEKPENCLFVDDRIKNVTAAEAIGINGVLFGNAVDKSDYSGEQIADFTTLYEYISAHQ